MKLISLVVMLFSFSCLAQNEIAYEFVSYQNKDLAKDNTPIVKIDHYWKIYASGKVQVIDRAGKCTELILDVAVIQLLDKATNDGLENFRNKTSPPANEFYAGYYSFLKKGDETICFNPYDVDDNLKKALQDIETAIKNGNGSTSNCSLPENLTALIQTTHSKSNLRTNASPPPGIVIDDNNR